MLRFIIFSSVMALSSCDYGKSAQDKAEVLSVLSDISRLIKLADNYDKIQDFETRRDKDDAFLSMYKKLQEARSAGLCHLDNKAKKNMTRLQICSPKKSNVQKEGQKCPMFFATRAEKINSGGEWRWERSTSLRGRGFNLEYGNEIDFKLSTDKNPHEEKDLIVYNIKGKINSSRALEGKCTISQSGTKRTIILDLHLFSAFDVTQYEPAIIRFEIFTEPKQTVSNVLSFKTTLNGEELKREEFVSIYPLLSVLINYNWPNKSPH